MRMKKTAIVILITLIISGLVPGLSLSAAPDLSVSADSAVVMEAVTGRVIWAKNEKIQRPMASTTKIMTTLLLLESGNLDETFTVDADAIKVEGSSMGLQEGDVVTKRALATGMLLPSGNDAANASAVVLAGNLADFSVMMNRKAAEFGMIDSHFITPSGLHDDQHYSTAYDMALLARQAVKNKDFMEICSRQTAKLSFGNPPYDRWLKNTNKLLSRYEGCIGMKTGFTDEAGRCLVSVAERNGVTLICVTLKAPDDWNDHAKLLDYGFSQLKLYEVQIPQIAGRVPVVGGEEESLPLRWEEEQPKIPLLKDDLGEITSKVLLPSFLYAPVEGNAEVGRVEFYYRGECIQKIPLRTAASMSASSETDETIFSRIKSWFLNLFSSGNTEQAA